MPGRWSTASFLSLMASAAAARSCSSGTFEKPYWYDEPPSPSPCETSITGTPASARPPTTARTCSGVNWCAMAWLPSRSVVSQIRGLTSRPAILLTFTAALSAERDSSPASLATDGRSRAIPYGFTPAHHPRPRRPIIRASRAGRNFLAALRQQVLGELLADLH